MKLFFSRISLICLSLLARSALIADRADLEQQVTDLEQVFNDRDKQIAWNQKLLDNLSVTASANKAAAKDQLLLLAKRIKLLNELNNTYNKNDQFAYDARRAAIDAYAKGGKQYPEVLKLMVVGRDINDQLLKPLVDDYLKLAAKDQPRTLGDTSSGATIVFNNGSLSYTDEDQVFLLQKYIDANIRTGSSSLLNKLKAAVSDAPQSRPAQDPQRMF